MGESGTTIYTVSGGAATKQYITDGKMTVKVEGDNVTFTLNSTACKAKYTVAIADLAAKGITIEDLGTPEVSYIELTSLISASDYNGFGVKLAGIEAASEGVSYTTDAQWNKFYTGEGYIVKFELYCDGGKITTGEYKACAVGGTVGEGEFGIGYDGFMGESGTTIYTVSGGAATKQYVTDGTMTVALDGDNVTLTLESSVGNAKCTIAKADLATKGIIVE